MPTLHFHVYQPLAPSRGHARDSIRDAGALSVFPSSIPYLPAVLFLCLTSVPIPFAGLRTWSTLPPCTYSDLRQLGFNTLRIPLPKYETVEPPMPLPAPAADKQNMMQWRPPLSSWRVVTAPTSIGQVSFGGHVKPSRNCMQSKSSLL